MKPLHLARIAALVGSTLVRSQDVSVDPTPEPAVVPGATPTTAYIVGDIPDGTPPPASPPKPVFVAPATDVLAATTHLQGGRTITIQQIKPIALPPPPEPTQPVAPLDNAELQERVADIEGEYGKWDFLFLGATVYRFKDAPTRTLVRFQPDARGETITFWSSADFSLIAGGIQSFVDSNGATHSLMMAWSFEDTDHLAALSAAQGQEYQVPNIPVFPDGPATFAIVGETPAADVLAPIQSLHELYNREHDRLKAAYDGRETARLQHEAELKANPPRPKNLVLNYWRTEKPIAVKGESK